MTNDSVFITLVKNWESSCRLISSVTEDVTPTEASLLRTIPIDGSTIDVNWIQKASNTLSELISDAQKLNGEQKDIVGEICEQLKNRYVKMRQLHAKLNINHIL